MSIKWSVQHWANILWSNMDWSWQSIGWRRYFKWSATWISDQLTEWMQCRDTTKHSNIILHLKCFTILSTHVLCAWAWVDMPHKHLHGPGWDISSSTCGRQHLRAFPRCSDKGWVSTYMFRIHSLARCGACAVLDKISVTWVVFYLGHSECLYLVVWLFSARYRPAENKSNLHFFRKTQISGINFL